METASIEQVEAKRIVQWMRNVIADANVKTEPLRREYEAYKRSLTDLIYDDVVHRVIRFFNLADQGFFLRVFREAQAVCAITEEDC